MTDTTTRPAEAVTRPVAASPARRAGSSACGPPPSWANASCMLLVLLAVVFAAIELLPGDAASATSERGEGAAGVAARRHLLGLDRPVWERFWDWITALPTGDLGTSARGRAGHRPARRPLPNTSLLGGTAFVLTAPRPRSPSAAGPPPGPAASWTASVDLTSTAAFALPEFVVSIGLLLVLSLWTGWLPAATVTSGDGSPASWTMLVMPVLALTVPQTGWNTRIVRAALADQASTPHVEAAHLDGLPPGGSCCGTPCPAPGPPSPPEWPPSTGPLLGGTVVVETLFNYPGIGTVLAGAVADRDTPVIAGVVACAAALITVILLLADLVRARTLGARP